MTGTILAADSSLTLGEARVSFLGTGDADTTWPDGKFILQGRATPAETLAAVCSGYFTSAISLEKSTGAETEIRLIPVAARKLSGRTFLIDPRYGGTESGERNPLGLRAADINLEIAWRLTELLRGAGADAHLLRSTDSTIAETERSRRSSEYHRGMYIRIDAAEPAIRAGAEIYRSISNRRMAERILASLATVAQMETTGVKPSNEQFFNDVAMGTISIRLPSVATGFYDSSAARRIDRIAWCLFGGILQDAGFTDPAPTVSRYPAGVSSVSLGRVFRQIPDPSGEVYFFGLDASGVTPSPAPIGRAPLRRTP
jgi:N-acetylmuramoyl-L-alanine amidase